MGLPKHIGGKAAGLHTLRSLGFNVPNFAIVSYNQLIHDQWIQSIEELGDGPFAVRSSASMEDGQEHSFAGQFESFLDVEKKDLEQAIRACFEAYTSARVEKYVDHAEQGVSAESSVENQVVIVQQMIKGAYAGVAFTSNPIDHRRDEMLIQYVKGAGHQLVDGKTAAKSIHINIYKQEDTSNTELPSIAVKELIEGLRSLKKQAEIDVEWVIDEEGRLYWLQHRPITTLSAFHPGEFDSQVSFEGEELTRANVGEMMPGHMTPLTISTFGRAIEVGIQHFYMECGVIDQMTDRWDYIKVFYNHGFISIGNLYRIADALWLPKYEFVEFNLLGRTLSHRNYTAVHFPWWKKIVNQIKQVRYLGKAKKRLDWIEKRRDMTTVPSFESLTDYVDWLDEHLDLLNTMYSYHYCTSARSGTLYTAALGILSGSPIPTKEAQAAATQFMKHIDGIEGQLVIKGLVNIAHQLQSECDQIDQMDDQALLDWLQTSQGKSNALFTDFIEKYGHHCVREAELSEKDWSQDPLLIIPSLRAMADSPREEGTQSHLDFNLIYQKLDAEYDFKLNRLARYFLARFIRQSREAVQMRERSKSACIKFQQIIKKTYLKIADRFVEQGDLQQITDIFFLTHQEVCQLIHGQIQVANRIQLRRQADQFYKGLTFDELYRGHPYPSQSATQAESQANDSKGAVVSSGKVRGPVRLVHSLAEAKSLQKGEIMICQYTDIGWTPYFSIIGGLITEIGSALSHGAVIAREYGLPAIVNYTDALQYFENGQWIEIDSTQAQPIRLLHGEDDTSHDTSHDTEIGAK